MPLEPGTRWTWDFVRRSPELGDRQDSRREEAAYSVSLRIVDRFDHDGYAVWEMEADGPWYLMLLFRIALGAPARGYVARVDGEHYFTPDRSDLEKLPSIRDFTSIPVPAVIEPGVHTIEWSGDTFLAHYRQDYLGEVLPASDVRRLGVGVAPETPCIAVSTSSYGFVWEDPQIVLAEGLGIVYGKNKLGDFYLRSIERPEAGKTWRTMLDVLTPWRQCHESRGEDMVANDGASR